MKKLLTIYVAAWVVTIAALAGIEPAPPQTTAYIRTLLRATTAAAARSTLGVSEGTTNLVQNGFTTNTLPALVDAGASVLTNVARIVLGDGTAALPAITFGSDQDSGFVKEAAGRIAISLDGANRTFFDTLSIQAPSGTVSSPGVRFTADTAKGMYHISSGLLGFSTAATLRMYIGAGVVGINTSSADRALEINSATGDNLRLTYNDSNGSAANYTDFSVSSSGDLTTAPSGGDASVTGRWASTPTTNTLGAAATTTAITSNVVKIIGDAGSNILATITGGLNGQILTLWFADGLVTITDDATGTANTVNLSLAFVGSANDTLTLLFVEGSWREVSRSVN